MVVTRTATRIVDPIAAENEPHDLSGVTLDCRCCLGQKLGKAYARTGDALYAYYVSGDPDRKAAVVPKRFQSVENGSVQTNRGNA